MVNKGEVCNPDHLSWSGEGAVHREPAQGPVVSDTAGPDQRGSAVCAQVSSVFIHIQIHQTSKYIGQKLIHVQQIRQICE